MRGQGAHEAVREGGRKGGAQSLLRKASSELSFGLPRVLKSALEKGARLGDRVGFTPEITTRNKGSLSLPPGPPAPSSDPEAARPPQPGGLGVGRPPRTPRNPSGQPTYPQQSSPEVRSCTC